MSALSRRGGLYQVQGTLQTIAIELQIGRKFLWERNHKKFWVHLDQVLVVKIKRNLCKANNLRQKVPFLFALRPLFIILDRLLQVEILLYISSVKQSNYKLQHLNRQLTNEETLPHSGLLNKKWLVKMLPKPKRTPMWHLHRLAALGDQRHSQRKITWVSGVGLRAVSGHRLIFKKIWSPKVCFRINRNTQSCDHLLSQS